MINESGLFNITDGRTYNWVAIVVLPLFIVCGLVGNSLVCMAIATNKKLQNVTNYFLFSLAITDLLVCFLVMPFSIWADFFHGQWYIGFETCLFHIYSDVFLTTASIIHMTGISLDRFWGISQPLKSRSQSNYVVRLKIVIVWLLSLVISSPILVLGLVNRSNVYQEERCVIFNSDFMIYGSIFAFLVPLITMIAIYIQTARLLQRQALLCKADAETGVRRTMTGHPQRKLATRPLLATEGRRTRSSCHLRAPKYGGVSNGRGSCSSTLDEKQDRYQGVRTRSTIQVYQSATSDGGGSTNHIQALLAMHIKQTQDCPELENFVVDGDDDMMRNIRVKILEGAATVVNFAKKKAAQDVANEQKATRVLGLVFVSFFICWTPFFTMNFTLAFCKRCHDIPPVISSIFLWLGYISSTVNPIIYTIFNEEFRQSFAKNLRRLCLNHLFCKSATEIESSKRPSAMTLTDYGREMGLRKDWSHQLLLEQRRCTLHF